MTHVQVKPWVACLALAAISVCSTGIARAQWPSRPEGSVTLSPPGYRAVPLDACTDGAGGAWVAWATASPQQTFLSHIDSYGYETPAAGPLLFDPLLISLQQLAPDGAGGAIALQLTWSPESGSGLWLHRVSSTGERLWTTPCWQDSRISSNLDYKLVGDAAGQGYLVAWFNNSSTRSVLRAQRFDMQGHRLWSDTGMVVAIAHDEIRISAGDSHRSGCLAPDDRGGAWIAFSSGTGPTACRVQHLGADGSPQWPDTGRFVPHGPSGLYPNSMVPDGSGGVYVSWADFVTFDVGFDAVQRVRTDGSIAFGPDGATLPAPGDARELPQLGTQVNGHVIVSWQTLEPDIRGTRVQMLDSTGVWVWPGGGVLVGENFVSEWLGGRVFTNADGGATLSIRFPPGTQFPPEIPSVGGVRRFSPDGESMWSDPPPAWTTETNDQWMRSTSEVLRVPTGDGGLLFFADYADSGSGFDPDAYRIRAKHIDAHGRFGQTVPRIVSVCDVPNDLGGAVEVRWQASSLEGDSTMATVGYDVLRTQPDGSGGTALFVVASNDALGDSEYVARVPTLADSTSPDSPPTVIRIRAHDASGREWLSPAVSGASFANSPPLAVEPPTPHMLSLSTPQPSPASSRTQVRYSLATAGAVTLDLLDVAGRRVRVLADGWRVPGAHSESLELTGDAGHRLPAGLYFVRLTAAGRSLMRRLVVLP